MENDVTIMKTLDLFERATEDMPQSLSYRYIKDVCSTILKRNKCCYVLRKVTDVLIITTPYDTNKYVM